MAALFVRDDHGIPVGIPSDAECRTIMIVTAVLMATSWITFGLRAWTRIVIVRSFGWDDGMMLVAAITYSAYSSLLFALAHLIRGQNIMSFDRLLLTTNILLALETLYIVAIAFLKVSLGLFFLRILVVTWQRRIIQTIMIISSLFSIGYAFYTIFQCGVPGQGMPFWQKKFAIKCVPKLSGWILNYFHGVFTAATDIIFVSIPIYVVVRSHMQRHEKSVVITILAMASLGCIASLVRIKYLPVLVGFTLEFYRRAASLGLWSSIEVGIGITAGCLATLRPLFRGVAARASSFVMQIPERVSIGRPSRSKTSTQVTVSQAETTDTNEVPLGMSERPEASTRSVFPRPNNHISDQWPTVSNDPDVEALHETRYYHTSNARAPRSELRGLPLGLWSRTTRSDVTSSSF